MAGYASSQFRPINALIQVSLPELKGVRDAKGRFTSAQGAMRERNHNFAISLLADVVEYTAARITRPGASTGRLIKVTGNPQNAVYDTWGAGVGVEDWLDSSTAKYWRTFEEGSAATWHRPFIGTQLMPKGRPPYPVPHGATPGLRTAYGTLPWMDGERYVVKHEIEPRNAYRDAVDAANVDEFAYENAVRLIRDIWES